MNEVRPSDETTLGELEFKLQLVRREHPRLNPNAKAEIADKLKLELQR